MHAHIVQSIQGGCDWNVIRDTIGGNAEENAAFGTIAFLLWLILAFLNEFPSARFWSQVSQGKRLLSMASCLNQFKAAWRYLLPSYCSGSK